MSTQIAQTILAQLGGNRFIAMTGARDLLATENGLHFKFPKGRNGANVCRITLSPADLYTVEFLSLRGLNVTPKGQPEFGVYADALRATFTAATGLDTSL